MHYLYIVRRNSNSRGVWLSNLWILGGVSGICTTSSPYKNQHLGIFSTSSKFLKIYVLFHLELSITCLYGNNDFKQANGLGHIWSKWSLTMAWAIITQHLSLLIKDKGFINIFIVINRPEWWKFLANLEFIKSALRGVKGGDYHPQPSLKYRNVAWMTES